MNEGKIIYSKTLAMLLLLFSIISGNLNAAQHVFLTFKTGTMSGSKAILSNYGNGDSEKKWKGPHFMVGVVDDNGYGALFDSTGKVGLDTALFSPRGIQYVALSGNKAVENLIKGDLRHSSNAKKSFDTKTNFFEGSIASFLNPGDDPAYHYKNVYMVKIEDDLPLEKVLRMVYLNAGRNTNASQYNIIQQNCYAFATNMFNILAGGDSKSLIEKFKNIRNTLLASPTKVIELLESKYEGRIKKYKIEDLDHLLNSSMSKTKPEFDLLSKVRFSSVFQGDKTGDILFGNKDVLFTDDFNLEYKLENALWRSSLFAKYAILNVEKRKQDGSLETKQVVLKYRDGENLYEDPYFIKLAQKFYNLTNTEERRSIITDNAVGLENHTWKRAFKTIAGSMGRTMAYMGVQYLMGEDLQSKSSMEKMTKFLQKHNEDHREKLLEQMKEQQKEARQTTAHMMREFILNRLFVLKSELSSKEMQMLRELDVGEYGALLPSLEEHNLMLVASILRKKQQNHEAFYSHLELPSEFYKEFFKQLFHYRLDTFQIENSIELPNHLIDFSGSTTKALDLITGKNALKSYLSVQSKYRIYPNGFIKITDGGKKRFEFVDFDKSYPGYIKLTL